MVAKEWNSYAAFPPFSPSWPVPLCASCRPTSAAQPGDFLDLFDVVANLKSASGSGDPGCQLVQQRIRPKAYVPRGITSNAPI